MTENGWDEETAVREVLKSLGMSGEEKRAKKRREAHYYTGDAFQNGKYSFSAQGHNGTIEILKRSKTGFLTIKINDAEKTIRRRPKAGLNWFYIPVWNGVCDVDVEINTFNITKL
jgi:hypothetical protein